ncbi:MAG: FG-GAP-like repeat-containing protein [Planctomycetota bacterium]
MDLTGRERFGSAVSGAGDVNGDGFEDVIIGAPRRANLAGAALVYSGRNGTLLHELLGEDFLDYAGVDVSSAGDVNNDGLADLIVGSQGGYAQVFSGADGSLAYVSRRGFPIEGYGVSVDEVGDIDHDGFSDLVVGSPGGGGTGKAYVLSGRRGDLLYLLQGDNVGEQFGADVCGAGDLNGDGTPDILVASPLAQAGGTTVGAARAFSVRNGGPLHNWVGSADFEWFGRSVAGAGDLNGDGLADVAIGSPLGDSLLHLNAGRVTAHAGNDLFLEGAPVDPALGSLFSLAVRQNIPGSPVLLSIVALNGNPVSIPIALGSFDLNWEYHLSEVLPPGLSGISLSIRACTRDYFGNLLVSSDVDLNF